jgi:hypothetical protein
LFYKTIIGFGFYKNTTRLDFYHDKCRVGAAHPTFIVIFRLFFNPFEQTHAGLMS